MNAVADVTTGTVTAVVEIDAPPEVVFRALTDPAELETWWGADDAYRTFDWHIDLRPGGEWSCQARNAGERLSSVRGRYITVDPPRVLEYTWQPSWEGFAETTIRHELVRVDGRTRLSVTHSGFGKRGASCNEHAAGWNRVLAWLTSYLGPDA